MVAALGVPKCASLRFDADSRFGISTSSAVGWLTLGVAGVTVVEDDASADEEATVDVVAARGVEVAVVLALLALSSAARQWPRLFRLSPMMNWGK